MLTHIAGKTYCLATPAATIGVYLIDKHNCLLIDSGEAAHGQQVLDFLNEQGWRVSAIINTHAHADHCGANKLIAEATGADIYASAPEKIFLENPWLIPYTLFSAHPPRSLDNRFIVPPASPEVEAVSPGNCVMQGVSIQFFDLSGHTPGQIGVFTPDQVLFAGDSLLSSQAYHTFPCPVVADVKSQLTALETLAESRYDHLCISHGGWVDQPLAVIEQNREWLLGLINDVLGALQGQAMNREQLVSCIIEKRKLTVNTVQFYLAWSSVSAVISYLLDNRSIKTHFHPAGITYTAR
ncbi:MAG TPA: MBL fold metallo-hydrolase [Syntrophomonadaceae bacterium]|nr:MBL fold metallo-hydrolase [Syntrophomonadaceae bacterium]HQA06550.1 MBL fold metallo-hydrolase [Syntrophomonadaceae bacterium]HQE22469.1 MBL fold metallo-hydrolase [Syntrophomonadaceae bacterium]